MMKGIRKKKGNQKARLGGGKAYLPKDKKLGGDSPHKLYPHSAWSRNYQKICVNGAPEGRRQVFIIDLKEVI